MILFFFWPLPLSLFFIITAVSLVALFILNAYATGTAKIVIQMLIHAISVISFLGFVAYVTTILMRSCDPEVTRTVVIAIVLFVLLTAGFFYYIGKKKI